MPDVPAPAERARVDLEIQLAAVGAAVTADGFRLARGRVALLALARAAADPLPTRHGLPIIVAAMEREDESRLVAALGIEAGRRIAIVNEPDGWLDHLGPLPAGTTLFDRASEPLDVIVYFSDELANVERRVPVFAGFVRPGGIVWTATPEGSEELTPSAVDRVGRGAGLTPGERVRIAPGWSALPLERR